MLRIQLGAGSICAHQWLKNGDHPDDYAEPVEGFEKGELVTFSPSHQRGHDWEGQVVRRYRSPEVDGESVCPTCHNTMHVHGWIDQGEQGLTVCPGMRVAKLNEEYVLISQ